MRTKHQLAGLMQDESASGRSKDSLYLRDVVFWLSLFIASLSLTLPFTRYLCFLIPFMVLIVSIGERRALLVPEVRAFVWYAVFGLAMYPKAHPEGLRDFFLALSGVSIAMLYRMPNVKIETILLWLVGGFLIYNSLTGALFGPYVFDFVNSVSSFEGNYAFEFALLIPFALHRKRWLAFLVATALAVLTLKRITLLAALACCLLQFLPPRLGRRLLSPPVMVIFNLAVLGLTMFYSLGYMDAAIRELTGQSANQLGLGRRVLQQVPSMQIASNPLDFLFYGAGPGQAYEAAAIGANQYSKASLHSDLLKLFYEQGFVFFCVFIWLMYTVPSYMGRIGMFFLNILFMTDNTLTYYFFLFYFFVCMRTQISEDGSGWVPPWLMKRPTLHGY